MFPTRHGCKKNDNCKTALIVEATFFTFSKFRSRASASQPSQAHEAQTSRPERRTEHDRRLSRFTSRKSAQKNQGILLFRGLRSPVFHEICSGHWRQRKQKYR